MTWLQTLPTICVALLLIFVPGAIWARCLGARGMTWLGVSAPLSVSLIGVGAVLSQEFNVSWTLFALVSITLTVSVLTIAFRYLILRGGAFTPFRTWNFPPAATVVALLGGLAFAGSVITWRFTRMFVRPENISQTYDNVFHLNAIKFIIDTGNGSSRSISSLELGGTSSFYPGAWHDLVALVVSTSNVSIPVGVNATNIMIGALVWTISAMYLATRLTASKPAILLMTGMLSGAFSAFPYLLVEFGVLYPNFLAISILPAMIALLADILKLSTAPRPDPILCLTLLGMAAPGLALAHPNVVLAFGAFTIPVLIAWLVGQFQVHFREGKHWIRIFVPVLLVAGYVVAVLTVWENVRPSEKASLWPPTQTIAQAIGEAVSNAPQRGALSWILLSLTILGMYALAKDRRQWWYLGFMSVGIMFYVVVSGFAASDLRSFITGVFYNDSFRLAALLPVAALPLTAFAAVTIYENLAARLPQYLLASRKSRITILASWTLIGLAGGVLAQNNTVDDAQHRGTKGYELNAAAPLLSLAESRLLARAEASIPAGATVIANPATGASLVYALADRNVILPAVGSSRSADDKVLTQQLQRPLTPTFCDTVTRLDAFYILDFGDRAILDVFIPFPTSAALASNPGLTLVDHEDEARLYRIDACN